MLDTIVIIALMFLLAIVTGYALDLRDANVQLQTSHDEAMDRAAETEHNLRFDVQVLGHACDRYQHYDRVQVRKIADQAKEIHNLTTELDELKVQHAKVVLGGTEITDEQQQAINANVSNLFGTELGCH